MAHLGAIGQLLMDAPVLRITRIAEAKNMIKFAHFGHESGVLSETGVVLWCTSNPRPKSRVLVRPDPKTDDLIYNEKRKKSPPKPRPLLGDCVGYVGGGDGRSKTAFCAVLR